ncbi:DUF6526 family protein [Flavobacterium sp. RHBU_24]|uniref:DUF6526 family protein n=1 Tax=Flavobacterium sp. RHBU_24 TaxID=3391185 RepID=UPI003984AE36
MKPQNYSNHIRWYVPHHFIFYPVMLVAMGLCACRAWCMEDERVIWLAIGFAFGCLTWLSYMLRQHYALTLQNRLVLHELRYRYFVITGNRLEPLEEQLTEGQLFALRFASDEEFVPLLNRAISEGLSAGAIKKAIVNWKGDYRRV